MKLLTPILVISPKLEFTITMHEGEMEREMYITNEERNAEKWQMLMQNFMNWRIFLLQMQGNMDL